MNSAPTPKDYSLLDIEPETGADEAERAYQKMKALYTEGSLATHSLMNEEERRNMLDRIEKAYLRISMKISRRPLDPSSPPLRTSDPVTPPAPREQHGEGTGPFLKRYREDKGMTLREVSKRTRVRSTYLESIEEEGYSQLPAPVYLRGFLIEFARVLGIEDPEKLASLYLARMEESEGEK